MTGTLRGTLEVHHWTLRQARKSELSVLGSTLNDEEPLNPQHVLKRSDVKILFIQRREYFYTHEMMRNSACELMGFLLK
ncbi:MAG: hypothetical protein U5L74_06725 [Ideonella sp.]|nr:hypothetical protein [Ideonella sp.]